VTFSATFTDVLERLDASGVPFMVTGSVAASYHGEPRATHDIDVVVDPTESQLLALVESLKAGGYYVDEEAARTAMRDRSQFNAIAPDQLKVDFIMRRDRAFSRAEFDRREAADLLGTPGWIVRPEDLVLAKLEWAAASDSDRQLRDVVGILEVNPSLDRTYIDRWAAELGIANQWRAVAEYGSDR
jgi:hypothetical protein